MVLLDLNIEALKRIRLHEKQLSVLAFATANVAYCTFEDEAALVVERYDHVNGQ